MRYKVRMTGRMYGQVKNDFKEILKRYGLRWRGSMTDPWWGSDAEKVSADYERDEERDMTITATLTWMGGKETGLLKEFTEWVEALGLKMEEVAGGEGSGAAEDGEDMYLWDMVHRPVEEEMRARGAPDEWIELELKDWRRSRAKRMGGD